MQISVSPSGVVATSDAVTSVVSTSIVRPLSVSWARVGSPESATTVTARRKGTIVRGRRDIVSLRE